jgi:hypothetical protein
MKMALEEIDISATNRALETPLAVDGGEHIAPTEANDGEG